MESEPRKYEKNLLTPHECFRLSKIIEKLKVYLQNEEMMNNMHANLRSVFLDVIGIRLNGTHLIQTNIESGVDIHRTVQIFTMNRVQAILATLVGALVIVCLALAVVVSQSNRNSSTGNL